MATNLTAKDLQMFARFRVPSEILAASGVARVSDAEARDVFGIRGDDDMAGLIFPYYDPETLNRVTCRLRRDNPDPDGHRKYICPWGDNHHLYFAPGAGALLHNPGVDVVLVEAEKSALALLALSERAGRHWLLIATGGCWGWRGKAGAEDENQSPDQRGALPDFNRVTWSGRKAYIIFDVNVLSNPEVQRARRALARELQGRGARVYLVNLPQEDGVNGPDDFISKHSDDGFVGLIDNATPFVDTQPAIILHPGESPQAVDEAEEILVQHSGRLRIFQRAGELVRVVTLSKPEADGGLRRSAGTTMLAPLGAVALTEILDRLIVWQKLRNTKDGPVPVRIDCPEKIAAAYRSRAGSWKLPELTGLISAPIMRPDGSVFCRAGYDSSTGLFLTEDWPEVNGAPKREDAVAALGRLLEPFGEFPFCEDSDRAVLAAAILTALQRRLLPSAPLFGFSAPSQRTGKSLLAESVAVIATGRPSPAMATSSEREEVRKAVATILREGHTIVNLDNIERPLESPDLARAITQIEYADRLLGESQMLRLPTNILWTATGTNLAFRGDLAVRALVCRIDAQVEHPEARTFRISDLKAHLAERRRELVVAGLTILRAFAAAGRPNQKLAPWGGFDEWSMTIRAPLVWLGMVDPCEGRQLVVEDDPDREQARVCWRPGIPRPEVRPLPSPTFLRLRRRMRDCGRHFFRWRAARPTEPELTHGDLPGGAENGRGGLSVAWR